MQDQIEEFARTVDLFNTIGRLPRLIATWVGGQVARVSSIEGDVDTTVAYQAKAGIVVPLSPRTGVIVEVSHTRTGELELGPQSFPNERNRIISESDLLSVSTMTVSYMFGF